MGAVMYSLKPYRHWASKGPFFALYSAIDGEFLNDYISSLINPLFFGS